MNLHRVDCGVADVADALALSDAAGWNQTADDWRLFMQHGRTIGLRTDEAALIATAAALPYGNTKGWISMVLVAGPWRHQGLATRLLATAVEHLRQHGVTPHLDATPAGVPAYRKAGFRAGFGLTRWEAQTAATGAPLPDSVRRADQVDLASLARLDAAANGMDRRFLLQDLLARAGTRAWATRDGSGFVIRRQGRRAAQIGPLVAASEQAAMVLLQTAIDDLAGPVFLDLPDRWQLVASALARRGFVVQRPFVRMALGSADLDAANDHLYVLAGPEFG